MLVSKLGTAEFIAGGTVLAHDPAATEPHYILSIIHKQFPFLLLFCPLQLKLLWDAAQQHGKHLGAFWWVQLPYGNKTLQLTVSKGCEIPIPTTFTSLYNILRRLGTGASSWNTCLKLSWLRHQKFQNSFPCTKLVHVYRQHFVWQAWQSWLNLASALVLLSHSQFLLSSVSDARYCMKSKGYQDGIQNISKHATCLFLKQLALFCWKRKPLQSNLFSICMGNSRYGFYPNHVRHRSYYH